MMPLSPKTDDKIRRSFDDLVSATEQLAAEVERINAQNNSLMTDWANDRHRRVRPQLQPLNELSFTRIHSRIISFLKGLSTYGYGTQIEWHIATIQTMHDASSAPQLHSIISGLQSDNLDGILEFSEQLEMPASQKQSQKWYVYLLSLFSAVLSIGVIWLGPSAIEWKWLLEHSDRYGLQVSANLTVLLLILGWSYPKRKTWIWGTGVFSFVTILVQLLGGKN